MAYETEQEAFWAGRFGTDYIERNRYALAPTIAFFGRALRAAQGVRSVFEIGANIGNNLAALAALLPDARLHGIEINAAAHAELRAHVPDALHGSILDTTPDETFDLVLCKGVLIHINPDRLGAVYDRAAALSRRYVLMVEYYAPTPQEVPYRGERDRLFKRDFAGEFMDRSGFALVDYGFVYRRDPVSPQDDVTYFLMERRA
ncbi:pseudaminic acid biosynthesis-associated methylase [Rhodothalassium salexigens DSM 2132]|uniref:Pseudaminic acid biosynthesis-associated methylase n=1 Tax=Rhodothalassium salexigens DSM 2132 TaxID=1188247 RepID=A0A4R2PGE1_RHOSA|nr:pseudaminic acid biosynthesis-associated methylase [Rhodothalassium salexigens]MBB4212131.1 spore coat polysaccharide biosynthesis protein SpsF [Rhodothalassium salexigens DSM 2132]MBK1638201.1 pseudaminic acid biosynthesis-associated methylase [Rhodothalassium salexigens DSM 2132]TCP33005.1 pseudaminic acid biosynthesis-associated methylase [Rhodothalassium salexigens DSM 2132]